jgi:hypothetical protein
MLRMSWAASRMLLALIQQHPQPTKPNCHLNRRLATQSMNLRCLSLFPRLKQLTAQLIHPLPWMSSALGRLFLILAIRQLRVLRLP